MRLQSLFKIFVFIILFGFGVSACRKRAPHQAIYAGERVDGNWKGLLTYPNQGRPDYLYLNLHQDNFFIDGSYIMGSSSGTVKGMINARNTLLLNLFRNGNTNCPTTYSAGTKIAGNTLSFDLNKKDCTSTILRAHATLKKE